MRGRFSSSARFWSGGIRRHGEFEWRCGGDSTTRLPGSVSVTPSGVLGEGNRLAIRQENGGLEKLLAIGWAAGVSGIFEPSAGALRTWRNSNLSSVERVATPHEIEAMLVPAGVGQEVLE